MKYTKCEDCDGQGEYKEHNFDKEVDAPLFDIVTCRFCNGSGEIKVEE